MLGKKTENAAWIIEKITEVYENGKWIIKEIKCKYECKEGYYNTKRYECIPVVGKSCSDEKHWEISSRRGYPFGIYDWKCVSDYRYSSKTCKDINPKPEMGVWVNYTEELKETYINGSWVFDENQCEWECLRGSDENCVPVEGSACDNDESYRYDWEKGDELAPHHWEYLPYEGVEMWRCISNSRKPSTAGISDDELCVNIYKPEDAEWCCGKTIPHDTYEDGVWVIHLARECGWRCQSGFKQVNDTCVLKTTLSDSEYCLGDSNYTASCSQTNVQDRKTCLEKKKDAHETCEDEIEKAKTKYQTQVNNYNKTVITWSENKIIDSQAYFTEEQNLIKIREDAIKERESILLRKKASLNTIKRISNKYVSDLKLEKTNLKDLYDSFKIYKDKWNTVKQDFKNLATLSASETDRSQLTIYLFDASGKMNSDFSEGDGIFRDIIRLRDRLIKIQKIYDREIYPYQYPMLEHDLKVLDETKIPVDFLRRMNIYISQRKALVKRTGEKMMLDIDTRIKTLIVSQATAEAQVLYNEASNNMAIAAFIKLVSKKMSKANVTVEESTSTIYSYKYSKYRAYKEFLEFKIFCNDIENEQMSYRIGGCNLYNNKVEAIEFHLADTMPFLIDDALYDLETNADELQLDYITKAREALTNDDLGTAAYYYDRILRVEDAK